MSLALTLEFSGGAELLVGNVKKHDVTIQTVADKTYKLQVNKYH